MMEIFCENSKQLLSLITFSKSSILDVYQRPKYATEVANLLISCLQNVRSDFSRAVSLLKASTRPPLKNKKQLLIHLQRDSQEKKLT